MPDWLQWIIYILIVIVMLGVLIAIHEAGHLATAKLFKVYCFEYSIGMGPKVFSKKRKGGETTFSLRAVPFGGYVSMYGEEGAVPEGMEEPPGERSLNNIAKWKKAIVLVAGVTLNFALGLVLIYIGDAACPVFYSARRGVIDEKEEALTVYLDATYDNQTLSYIDGHKPEGSTYEAKDYVVSLPLYSSTSPLGIKETYQILACDISIYKDASMSEKVTDTTYVAVYTPATVIDPHGLGNSFYLFPKANAEIPAELARFGVTGVPEVYNENKELNNYNFANSANGVTINMPLSLLPKEKARAGDEYLSSRIVYDSLKLSVNNGALTGDAVRIEVISGYNSFQEGWRRWSEDVPRACTAVAQGFASLFQPGGWRNVSGIIGITAAMPQINAAGGARMIFYFAGMISINLAFFNLIPFPGLDGWSLLVTAIEGVTRKKVPQKVQGIVSVVGLVLLMALMAFIAVKDIVALF